MKVAINKCYGGFSLSKEAQELIDKLEIERIGEPIPKGTWVDDEYRTNPSVIKAIETLGEKANTNYSELRVVEIPDDVEWEVEEYDGIEWISEVHETWG